MNRLSSKRTEHILLLFASAWILSGACAEFYNIAWGTGIWLGQFSFKWFLFFVLFFLFCIACLGGIVLSLWFPERLSSDFTRLSNVRDGLKTFRWLLVIGILLIPVYFFQYTPWGVIFDESNLRFLIWALSVILIGWLISTGSDEIFSWKGLLVALVLTSGVYNLFARLGNLTSYPFSLGWSEGNRLWDYSILFGSSIYEYPADKTIPVFLDFGRQLAGGIPFLIPGLTIWQERLWLGLINIIPYMILGWIAFKLPEKKSVYWILAGVWAFTFVAQGPIHSPLLWCAILVAFSWRKPLWFAVPLILVAGYFAQLSRYTWLFAPAMWAVMLEFGGAKLQDNRLNKTTWVRGISVGLAGLLGGYLIPQYFIPLYQRLSDPNSVGSPGLGGTSVSSVGDQIADQPLLWYRLFPNSSFTPGILLALIYAVAPLLIILIYLILTRQWRLNIWQKYALGLPLLAFLIVGLIVSVKIGGGGDLHNMDMFIIGLMFAAAIAWRNFAWGWVERTDTSPLLMRLAILFMIITPAYIPYLQLMPNNMDKADLNWMSLLADIPATRPMPDTMPSDKDVTDALSVIRNEVANASQQGGEVLFMDQRQLLTFGYVTDVALIPEYDKKLLMDKALSGDTQYFEGFYKDLATQRFALIITNPLHERIQTDLDDFNEENNAWVTWVSTPVLCYYEPLVTMRKVTIQLLIPRADISGCAQKLP
jgi:hypothetical protein